MNNLERLKARRSIRKYLPKRVPHDKLDKIIEAGLYAPNAGGGQSTRIIMLDFPELIEQIGIVNANCEDRTRGMRVSTQQPSIMDDLTIRSGFYGAPALAIVCIPKARAQMVNMIGSAFTCVQNMVTEAYAAGISSCIVGRAEATFEPPFMQTLLDEWGLDKDYTPIAFVCLGYVDGPLPDAKPRKKDRVIRVYQE